MRLSKAEVLNLIEPHFEKDLLQENYEVKNIKAHNLLRHNRFDLAFKLFYLEMKNKDKNLANVIYREHIRAFTLNNFVEPGNKEKNSIDKYIKLFDNTFNDIKENGFDNRKTLIPVSKNFSILNGSHRVASAIYLKKDVSCVKIDLSDNLYDYNFFYQRNIKKDILDLVAIKFIEYAKNIHIAFLWPTGENTKEAEDIISNIVYEKNIQLNSNGAHNLISQIYYGEEWLGKVENDFKGSKEKIVECFKTFDSFKVIAFQAENLEEVLKVKEKIRNIFDIGKHSIHITDTKEEAIRIARIIFNDNSIHFLNYAKPNKFITTHKKIDRLKEFLYENDIDERDIVLNGDFILSCYGIKEIHDIEFFYINNKKIMYPRGNINDICTEEVKYYNLEKNELIYNPKNYFYFNDIKFISFNQLYKMKANRAEKKDQNDCQMMEVLIEENKLKEFISKIQQYILYNKVKVRAKIVNLLKVVGLHNTIRNILKNN